MTTVTTRPEFVTEEHLTFLGELRESGITNMCGATPFILDRFWGLTAPQARELLTYWMETFATRQTAEYLALVRNRGNYETDDGDDS